MITNHYKFNQNIPASVRCRFDDVMCMCVAVAAEDRQLDHRTIGIIVGILCALILLMLAAVAIILLRRRCYRCYVYSRQAFKPAPPRGQGVRSRL
jgi:hypothetical protein